MDEAVDPKFFSVALREVSKDDFERFGQAFYASIEGKEFVPLGGVGDGGADGLFSNTDESGRARALQITKQADLKGKVRETVKRLQEFGRDPKSLTMLVSYNVQNLDNLEEELSDKYDIRIRIRDSRYLETQVNQNVGTRAAANSYVLPFAEFLLNPGASRLISVSENLPLPTLCAFMGQ